MGNDIGDVAGNVSQMVCPNEKPLKRSTGSKRLVLIQSDFMKEGLSGKMVLVDVLLEVFWQMFVVQQHNCDG